MPDIPSKNPFQRKPQRNPKQRKADRYNSHRQSANFATLIDTIKDEGSAYRKEEQREDRGKRFREYITIFLIAATFVAVCYQVHEMIKVYEPIKEQAAAAKIAAEAAMRQSENSEKSLIQAQRAWLGPTKARIEGALEIGKAPEIIIDYANTGREPALNFIYSIDTVFSTEAEEKRGTTFAKITLALEGCRLRSEISGGQVVFPSTGFSSYSLLVKPLGVVDQETIDGNKTLIVQGCFLYKSFNIIRHSYFCYFYRAKLSKLDNLNICTAGHYAD